MARYQSLICFLAYSGSLARSKDLAQVVTAWKQLAFYASGASCAPGDVGLFVTSATGLATIRHPVLEITATVEPFENAKGFSLRVHRARKPRSLAE
jgi:hypothetical protein